ncbi:hypothetical protein K438DRAFT_1943093 [Mycena galopus ATCC 62051]|nr:hypothetical protein K438DRAFT_1943093 [Mycena galopus ATCC 62051]
MLILAKALPARAPALEPPALLSILAGHAALVDRQASQAKISPKNRTRTVSDARCPVSDACCLVSDAWGPAPGACGHVSGAFGHFPDACGLSLLPVLRPHVLPSSTISMGAGFRAQERECLDPGHQSSRAGLCAVARWTLRGPLAGIGTVAFDCRDALGPPISLDNNYLPTHGEITEGILNGIVSTYAHSVSSAQQIDTGPVGGFTPGPTTRSRARAMQPRDNGNDGDESDDPPPRRNHNHGHSYLGTSTVQMQGRDVATIRILLLHQVS